MGAESPSFQSIPLKPTYVKSTYAKLAKRTSDRPIGQREYLGTLYEGQLHV